MDVLRQLLSWVWFGMGIWGLMLFGWKGYLSFYSRFFAFCLRLGFVFWIAFGWWTISIAWLLLCIPLLFGVFLGPITLAVAHLVSDRRPAPRFETLRFSLPVQTWVTGSGFRFGVPEGWEEWSPEMLSRYSVATQTQTLGGVQKTLPDSSSCWVAIASPSPAVRPAEFNRMLKATTPELAVGYNKGGSELLNEPHRVLVDGEPSLIFSIRLLTGAWQSHVATSHKGRVYAMLCEASNSRTFEHCTADFHTILATWQWM